MVLWREGRLEQCEAGRARSVVSRKTDEEQTGESGTTAPREKTSNKLYQKLLKWKEKRKLFQNLFRMHS